MPKTRKTTYDWSKLRTDEELKTSYTIEVTNRFQVLQSKTDSSADTRYYNIIQAHQKAAELHVPHRSRNKKKYCGKASMSVKKEKY